MKKLGYLFAVLALFGFGSTVFAKGPSAPAGASKTGQLYLYEKTPSATWPIVDKGAWGKMTYDLNGPLFSYVFNGHSIKSPGSYTLVYYPDPWPGIGLQCLGSGDVDGDTNVHIQQQVDTGSLPIATDGNFPGGAKIWLVKSSDVRCDVKEWNTTSAWKIKFLWMGTDYEHDATLTQVGSAITGNGGFPVSGPYAYAWHITSGAVVGDTVHLEISYDSGASCTMIMDGTIASDGSMSGTWSDNCGGSRAGTWASSAGAAALTSMVNQMTGWNPENYLFEDALITYTKN